MSSIVTEQKSILSDRQTDYLPEDLITIHLDSNDVAMLNGKDSYLHFTVRIENGNQVVGSQPSFKANLDPQGGGAYAVIDRMEIWNGDETALLENLEEVSTWMGVHNYFKKTEGIDNKRELLEGWPQNDYTPTNQPVSQYFLNGPTTPGDVQSQNVECCLPLPFSGIFGADNMFPVLGCQGGLVIKIYLAGAKKAIKAATPNGFILQRGTSGITANGRQPTVADFPYDTVGNGVAGEPVCPQDLPQCWQLAADALTAANPQLFIDVELAPAAVGIPVAPANLRANVGVPVDVAGELCNCVGQSLYYLNDAGVLEGPCAITAVAVAGAGVRFTITGYTATGDATAAARCPVAGAILSADSASYRITNFELIASSVENSPQYVKSVLAGLTAKGGLEVDIKSQNLYRQNQYAGDVKSQLLIPTTERRARALLQCQMNPVLAWHTSQAQPMADQLSGYQYIIANKNIPNRTVATEKETVPADNTWNALCDAERVKMLRASKIEPYREVHPAGHFVYGREVAKSGFYADLNTNDVRLTMDWGTSNGTGGASVAPQVDKLLYTYCRHFRSLVMTNANTVVNY